MALGLNTNTSGADFIPHIRYDARAGYRWQQWDAQLSVENLTDHEYYVSATSAAQIMPGSPRQLNLTAAYRF